ncbi:MAG: methionine biosynthesis protein MetW [Spirochaetes bacterium GWD1_27_9]|nr:MAG: methionine biosynthesis protein MetW [Spirochaetes bacterium GWB1_27_13]OHD27610.1 MAG: methionine biosynthesis protein MetW [Spirochaetes bacterium GWC1_27_15]OHD28984.1 MAG: methionine biosynthesis protein MetW [Spirochaetes bacterium GWD1_27_9]
MGKLKETIHEVISNEIPQNSKVLDLGCGSGELLEYLIKDKNIIGHGLDINDYAIINCIEKGIPVIQWDLDNLPLDFPDKSYDITILNQTITQVINSKKMILEMLRVGKEGILGFSNFGSLEIMLKFVFTGRMPITREIPFKWYDTPNIRLLTIKDFYDFCKANNIEIKKKVFLKKKLNSTKYKQIRLFTNLRSDLAVFWIKKI